MPKIAYKDISFRGNSLATIELVNDIIGKYQSMGYDLTLRQLYYQLVAGAHVENSDKSYKRIGELINNARLAGLVDWYAITDRTRNMKHRSHWDSPNEIIQSAINQYFIDLRKGQPHYVEVWVEKEALIEVVGKACNELDVPYFACRGYVSQSEMWVAAQRFKSEEYSHEDSIILHLGDHDPSGVDMTRDIQERLCLFGAKTKVNRIALTYAQVEKYAPPPNPAKITDSRCKGYIEKYGNESWELDALEPTVIHDLIVNTVDNLTDWEMLNERKSLLRKEKASMQKYADILEEEEDER